MEHDAVIIEVGLNEAAMRSQNPHVPYCPTRPASAPTTRGVAVRPGPSVIDWHARDPITGAQRVADARLYGEGLEHMGGD